MHHILLIKLVFIIFYLLSINYLTPTSEYLNIQSSTIQVAETLVDREGPDLGPGLESGPGQGSGSGRRSLQRWLTCVGTGWSRSMQFRIVWRDLTCRYVTVQYGTVQYGIVQYGIVHLPLLSLHFLFLSRSHTLTLSLSFYLSLFLSHTPSPSLSTTFSNSSFDLSMSFPPNYFPACYSAKSNWDALPFNSPH